MEILNANEYVSPVGYISVEAGPARGPTAGLAAAAERAGPTLESTVTAEDLRTLLPAAVGSERRKSANAFLEGYLVVGPKHHR